MAEAKQERSLISIVHPPGTDQNWYSKQEAVRCFACDGSSADVAEYGPLALVCATCRAYCDQGKDKEEQHQRLKQLLTKHHPSIYDCPDGECFQCAIRDCPHSDPLHYHHNGCTSCTVQELCAATLAAKAKAVWPRLVDAGSKPN